MLREQQMTSCRSEAIRRAIEIGLTAKPKRQSSHGEKQDDLQIKDVSYFGTFSRFQNLKSVADPWSRLGASHVGQLRFSRFSNGRKISLLRRPNVQG
jgi:hypothetical protein